MIHRYRKMLKLRIVRWRNSQIRRNGNQTSVLLKSGWHCSLLQKRAADPPPPALPPAVIWRTGYQNYSHQLAGDISQAANAMAAFSGAVPDGASANTLLSLADQVLDIFMPEM